MHCVDSVLMSPECVDVVSVADVSIVHFASIFRVEITRVSVHICIGFGSTDQQGNSECSWAVRASGEINVIRNRPLMKFTKFCIRVYVNIHPFYPLQTGTQRQHVRTSKTFGSAVHIRTVTRTSSKENMKTNHRENINSRIARKGNILWRV
jgi:hypothetical protein